MSTCRHTFTSTLAHSPTCTYSHALTHISRPEGGHLWDPTSGLSFVSDTDNVMSAALRGPRRGGAPRIATLASTQCLLLFRLLELC